MTSSRRSATLPGCSASATCRWSSGSASTATTRRAVPHGDGYLIVCGEAMSPPFLKADPFGAGAAAVVTNVSDVRAMGGTPLAIVDMLVSPDAEHANTVLDGMAWASEKLGVPIVGGHLTLGHEPALSASCTGFAKRPLQSRATRSPATRSSPRSPPRAAG